MKKRNKSKYILYSLYGLFFITIMFLDYSSKKEIKMIDKNIAQSQVLINQINDNQFNFSEKLSLIQSQIYIVDDKIKDANVQAITIQEVKPQPQITYTQEEFDMLCYTVMGEVGYCSIQSQQIVTSLIINRVKSDKFPNTIKEVLTAKEQFTSINNYYTKKIPITNELKQTVLDVLNGNMDYANGSIYYYAPRYTNKKLSKWFENNLSFVFEFEGQRFFKDKEVAKINGYFKK